MPEMAEEVGGRREGNDKEVDYCIHRHSVSLLVGRERGVSWESAADKIAL